MARYRILSIDGAGSKAGSFPCSCSRLDKRLPGWCDRVDLLAGPQLGIIALGLAKRLTHPLRNASSYDKSPRIFGESLLDDSRDQGRFDNEHADPRRRTWNRGSFTTSLASVRLMLLAPTCSGGWPNSAYHGSQIRL